MKKSYIALIDSGVGGLSVLKNFVDSFPNENYLYFGDNDNAPYGNKSIRELKKIVLQNIIYLNDYDIKFLVVACNTLSVNLLAFIKEICPYPVYGIYPPVEYFLIKKEKIALCSTSKTAEQFRKDKIDIFSLKNLAKDIENNLFSLENIVLNKYLFSSNRCYDRVILGCTHYFFIKNKFFDHFNHSYITCSEDFIYSFFINIIKSEKSLVKPKQNCILFVGKNSEKNKKFWEQVVKII